MSTLGVLQVHEEIIRTGGHCCCVCFRAGTERRLVEPEFLTILITQLPNAVRFKTKLPVCYMCEALARSALRFVKAVELATRVSDLFSGVSKEQWQDIVKLLGPKAKAERYKVQELNKECPARRALGLERELRSRPRFALYRTDTLVVTGGAAAAAPQPAPAPAAAITQTSKGMVILMQHEDYRPPLTTMVPVLQPMLPVLSPIVYPTMPQVPALTSRLPLLSIDPDHKHMRVRNKDTNETILHPIVKGIDGKIYVPSLQIQIADNGVLKSMDASQIQQSLPTTFAHTPNKSNLNTTNLNTANLNSANPTPPNFSSDNLKSTNLNTPNLKSTNLNSTNLKSANLNTANLNTANHKSTNLNSTNLQSTNLNSTNLQSTNLKSRNLNTTVANKRQNCVDPLTEQSEDNSAYYNFLVSQMKQKEDVKKSEITNDMITVLNEDDDDNTSSKKRKLAELDQTLSDVAHLLQENAQGACEIKYEIIDDDEDNEPNGNQVSSGNQVTSGNQGYGGSKSGNRVASDNGNHVSASSKSVGSKSVSSNSVKEPVLRTDRTVDWEDKIPMDVISFMDATDPNPEERIMQPPPMGIISDVRSIPDDPEPDGIECIDLC